MIRILTNLRKMHTKCRNNIYLRSSVERLPVPDSNTSWDFIWPSYQPPSYTDQRIKGQPWADPEISGEFQAKWNSLDGRVNRVSHSGRSRDRGPTLGRLIDLGLYAVENNRPLNPRGRTGISGRGCLGRWGPNHAADPIVTRWKRSKSGEIRKNEISSKPILQFVAIQRHDCGEWAVPGGMVDPGEHVTATLKREFMEEALNSLELNPGEDAESLVDEIFSQGREIYRGYVDDPRNTDNAWMETVAVNYHDEGGTTAGRLKLQAGDDASGVKWMDVDSQLALYASHRDFISKVAEYLKAHW